MFNAKYGLLWTLFLLASVQKGNNRNIQEPTGYDDLNNENENVTTRVIENNVIELFNPKGDNETFNDSAEDEHYGSVSNTSLANDSPAPEKISDHFIKANLKLHLHQNKKHLNPDFFNNLRPQEIFKPIADKFHHVIHNLYSVQPYINNDDYGTYGSGNYGPTYWPRPLEFLEKLHAKAQNIFSNAHGAIFGTGYYGYTDYPFAIRSLNKINEKNVN